MRNFNTYQVIVGILMLPFVAALAILRGDFSVFDKFYGDPLLPIGAGALILGGLVVTVLIARTLVYER